LYKFFGWGLPQFAHWPMILNTDRTKMSKRKGDVAVEDYIKKGYLKEAIINFIAFLGWNPGDEREIFSLEELIKEFDITKCHKAGAIFNIDKLNWYNSYYIKNKSDDELVELVKELSPDWATRVEKLFKLEKVIGLFKERLDTLLEIEAKAEFLLVDNLVYEKELLNWKQNTSEVTKKYLQGCYDKLSVSDFSDKNILEQGTIAWIKENGWSNGDVLWPLRVSLSGSKNSPGPFEIIGVLGRDKSLQRIKLAIDLLK